MAKLRRRTISPEFNDCAKRKRPAARAGSRAVRFTPMSRHREFDRLSDGSVVSLI
jgi:hypothetical protein